MLPEIFKDFMIKKLFDLAEGNFFFKFYFIFKLYIIVLVLEL